MGSGQVSDARAAALGLFAGATQAAAHHWSVAAIGTPLAAAALLLAVERGGGRRSVGVGALFGLVVAISFAPQSPSLVIAAFGTLMWVAATSLVALVGAWSTRSEAGPAVPFVAVPAVVGAIEWANGALSPLGDYLGVAAAVTGLTPLQVLGRWGGAPLVAAAGTGLGVAVLYIVRPSPRRRWAIGAAVGWLLPGLVAGSVNPSAEVRVAAVALPDRDRPSTPRKVAEQLASLTDRAARDGARLVVWPEAAVTLQSEPAVSPNPADETALTTIRAAASRNRVALVVGVFVRSASQNRALLVQPDGTLAGSYTKHHLIPGMEDYQPGTGGAVQVDVVGVPVPVGLQICFDDCFRDGSRQLSEADARLVAIPTQDWSAVAHRHARFAALRAACGRFAVVRAAHGGFSEIIDPAGRVVARRRSSPTEPVVLVATVPLRR